MSTGPDDPDHADRHDELPGPGAPGSKLDSNAAAGSDVSPGPIIDRRRAERRQGEPLQRALSEIAERRGFLLALSDALRGAADPAGALAVSCRMLGDFLGVSRVTYAETDGERFRVRGSHAHGVPAFEGRGPLDAFGAFLLNAERHRDIVTVEDVETDARLGEAERAQLRAFQVAAFVATTLIKGERCVGAFTVHHAAARTWTPGEIELIVDVADRARAAAERIRVEATIRESEGRYRQLFDTMDEGFAICELVRDDRGRAIDFRWLQCNASLERLTGLRPAAVIGRRGSEVLPAEYERCVRVYAHVIDTGEPIRFEQAVESLNRFWDLTAFPFGGDTFAVLHDDITERRRWEDALRESEARLREADRRKDEFLATLAHELRNPLAPIRTGLELIRLEAADRDAVERVRQMMDRQLSHMVRLVDDLLDVSRITSGKIRLQRSVSLLSTLVQSAVDSNRAALADTHIALDVQLPREPVWLDVDPTRLQQVLSNVLHNAIKFTDPGGLVTMKADVAASPGSDARELVLTVTDSGIGITPEMLPLVFDLFAQDDAPASRSEAGLGIGLALARRLVELHGGTIAASSDGRGSGSTFTVKLPGVLQSATPESSAAQPARHRPSARRVLVVDDNADAVTTMAMLVESLGATAATAYDGEAAVATALEFRPDIVLLDIGMPGIDGYETCRRLRAVMGSSVVLVALTGWGQPQDRDDAMRAGFDEHLTKPVDFTVVEQLLRR